MSTTSRQRVIQTLTHQPVDRAPRDLWTLPGVDKCQGEEIAELLRRFPLDIEKADYKYPAGLRAQGKPYEVGQYTDAWGCVWHVAEPGVVGEAKGHPLAEAAAWGSYQPPWELLEPAKMDRVNRSCAASSRFVLAWTETRPFERLQFLRGSEATYIDLAHGSGEMRRLLSMLHDFFCQELTMWAGSDVDGVEFMDDWGSQTSLLISPQMWRELFKPLYRDYCDILHAHDKYAFFHSDGFIAEILEDLIEVGVDAVNAQLFCMDMERLARDFRNKITFWGEIDRQRVLPFGKPGEVREAVDRVRRAFDFGRGGLIAQCEWGLRVPWSNVAAVFEQWLRPLPMHSSPNGSSAIPPPNFRPSTSRVEQGRG